MARDFYLHEDDWGMISLEPIENLANRREVTAKAAAHGDAHRAPDGVGWTAMLVAPPAPISIKNREITLPALAAVLGPTFTRLDRVSTGYSTHREDVSAGFAFQRGDSKPLDVVYGTVEGGVVCELNVTQVTRAMGDTLHALGTTFRLLICDLWCDAALDLTDRHELERYLAHVDPDDAP